jgi:hypothetical protein
MRGGDEQLARWERDAPSVRGWYRTLDTERRVVADGDARDDARVLPPPGHATRPWPCRDHVVRCPVQAAAWWGDGARESRGRWMSAGAVGSCGVRGCATVRCACT